LPPADTILANRTTTRLLDALRDHRNEPAWTQIDARYRPVIRGLARQFGLSESDSEEVSQQSLSEFVKAYHDGRYDRTKGRLSSWILGIAHHTTLKMIRSGKRAGLPGATVIAEVADEQQLRSIWDDERDREILARALAAIRDESVLDDRTLRAFELVGLRGVPAGEAAAQCQMSVDQVYVARSRVTKRLRTLMEEMTAAFEEDS